MMYVKRRRAAVTRYQSNQEKTKGRKRASQTPGRHDDVAPIPCEDHARVLLFFSAAYAYGRGAELSHSSPIRTTHSLTHALGVLSDDVSCKLILK